MAVLAQLIFWSTALSDESLLGPDIQRLLKTIRHQEVDRAPNYECRIKRRNLEAILDRPSAGDSTELPGDEYLELVRRIHQDALHVGTRWELGFVYRTASDGARSYVDGAIKGPDDLQRVCLPELGSLHQRIAALAAVIRGSRAGISCFIGGPFSTAYLAMGLKDFSLALYDDRAFVETLLDLTTQFCHQAVEVALRSPVDLLWILDDLAFGSGPMIRPRLIRELWLPRIRAIIAPARARGVPVVLHSDGNLTGLIPMVIEAGFDALHPIEPCGGAFDIYRVKAEYGRDLCLFGNIDVSGSLSLGGPEEVVADVREHIERLAEGGGYVVSSSHSIQDSVPPANFKAMLDTVVSYQK
jgi:uroporphyrinogen decarboxylase